MKLRVLPVGLALSLIVGMAVTPEQKAPDFNTKSELLQKTDVRNYIKKHSFSQSYEDSLKK